MRRASRFKITQKPKRDSHSKMNINWVWVHYYYGNNFQEEQLKDSAEIQNRKVTVEAFPKTVNSKNKTAVVFPHLFMWCRSVLGHSSTAKFRASKFCEVIFLAAST